MFDKYEAISGIPVPVLLQTNTYNSQIILVDYFSNRVVKDPRPFFPKLVHMIRLKLSNLFQGNL